MISAAVLAWAVVMFAAAWAADHLGHASLADTAYWIAGGALALGLSGLVLVSAVKRYLLRDSADIRNS